MLDKSSDFTALQGALDHHEDFRLGGENDRPITKGHRMLKGSRHHNSVDLCVPYENMVICAAFRYCRRLGGDEYFISIDIFNKCSLTWTNSLSVPVDYFRVKLLHIFSIEFDRLEQSPGEIYLFNLYEERPFRSIASDSSTSTLYALIGDHASLHLRICKFLSDGNVEKEVLPVLIQSDYDQCFYGAYAYGAVHFKLFKRCGEDDKAALLTFSPRDRQFTTQVFTRDSQLRLDEAYEAGESRIVMIYSVLVATFFDLHSKAYRMGHVSCDGTLDVRSIAMGKVAEMLNPEVRKQVHDARCNNASDLLRIVRSSTVNSSQPNLSEVHCLPPGVGQRQMGQLAPPGDIATQPNNKVAFNAPVRTVTVQETNDEIIIQWTDTPDGAAKQFRREWFQGDNMIRSKNLSIEYNL